MATKNTRTHKKNEITSMFSPKILGLSVGQLENTFPKCGILRYDDPAVEFWEFGFWRDRVEGESWLIGIRGWRNG